MTEFKVGDKVVGFDGKEGVEGIIEDGSHIRLAINNEIETKWFDTRYVYPSGTTFEIKEPKVRGGWFNRVKAESGIGFYISSQSPGETKKAAYENRNCELFTYLGPPVYIEAKEGEAPATITLKKEPWAKIKDAMDVEHQGMCGVDCARCEYDELIAEAEA